MKLDLTPYKVPFERFELVDALREELYELLRLPGLFKDGVEVVDAVLLARRIRDTEQDSVELDANEEELLKQAFNKLIARDHNPAKGLVAMGGARYEELIMRVFAK